MSNPISLTEISKLPAILDYDIFYGFIIEHDIFNLNQYNKHKKSMKENNLDNQINYEYLFHNISDHYVGSSKNSNNSNTINDISLKHQLSKDRFIEYISSTDCYISYEWGYDSLRRNNKTRITSIMNYLHQKYIICYTDDGQLNGMNLYSKITNPNDKIKHYITKSQCILICLTCRYYTKLLSKSSNSIQYEFDTIMNLKESRYIILCIMEESAYTIPIELQEKYPNIITKQKFNLINFEKDLFTNTNLITKSNETNEIRTKKSSIIDSDLLLVYEYIRSVITPLVLGGPFQKETQVFNSSIIGRHYQWFIKHIPSFTHEECLSYATTLYHTKIESTMRLLQLFQFNESSYITNLLNIPLLHTILIKDALRSDLSFNSNIHICKEITAITNTRNKEIFQHIQSELDHQSELMDRSNQYIENDCMAVEDQYSYNRRDYEKHLMNQVDFQQSRYEYITSAQERIDTVLNDITIANEYFQELLTAKNKQWNDSVFKQISEITEPEMISGTLYKLYIKVDQNTTHIFENKLKLDYVDVHVEKNSLSPTIEKNNNQNISDIITSRSFSTLKPLENTNSLDNNIEYSDGYYGIAHVLDDIHIKKSRIQRFIDCSFTTIGEEVDVRKIFENHLNGTKLSNEEIEANQYHMLQLLIEEACYISKTIEIICKAAAPDDFTSFPDVMDRFLNTGIVKLLVTLLSKIYLFQCKFYNNSMPLLYHKLTMPESILRAIRFVVKRGIGHRNVHSKLGYLFIEAGIIPLCIEILKFHQENINIVYQVLDLIFVLMDIPTLTELVITQFMNDINNLVFIIIFMERYDLASSSLEENKLIATQSCIIGILTYLIKSHSIRENLINIYRVYRMYHIYHIILQNANLLDKELCYRLCQIINNIFYVEENMSQHSLLYTSEYIEEMKDYRQIMQSKINYQIVICFMKQIYEEHCDNHVICSFSLISLGNLVFNNDTIKLEAYNQHIERNIINILKTKMKMFDTCYHISDHPYNTTTNSYNNKSSSSSSKKKKLHQLINNNNNDISYNNNDNNNNNNSYYNNHSNNNIEDNNINNNQQYAYRLSLLNECLCEALLTCNNLIIIPSYLPYDTLRTRQNYELIAPSKNINQLLAASVREDVNNTVVEYISNGICELVMNIITHYINEEKLLYSALIFIHKLIYRGRYISCCRFVSLGLCEQILVIMKQNSKYINNLEINLLCTLITTDLLSTHPILLNSNKRLMNGNVCEILATRMKSLCTSQSTVNKGGRQWMHGNYPYICKVCTVYCTALYCCLTSQGIDKNQMPYYINILSTHQIHSILVRPPKVLSSTLTLDKVLMNMSASYGGDRVSEEVIHKVTGHITTSIGTKTSLQLAQIMSFSSSTHQQLQHNTTNNITTTNSNSNKVLILQDITAQKKILSTGIFPSILPSLTTNTYNTTTNINNNTTSTNINNNTNNTNNNINSNNTTTKNNNAVEIYHNGRGIEYASVLSRTEKDHIMNTLFDILDIKI